MVKKYFAKHQDGSISTSNWPIKETGAESFEFEVDELDEAAVAEGTKDWVITDGQISTVESTRKADMEAAEAARLEAEEQKKAELESLKTKLSEGKASLSEIQTVLSKLI